MLPPHRQQPVEFCSDIFLLPLGVPQIDSIDLETDQYLRNPTRLSAANPPPVPPPRSPARLWNSGERDDSYYEMLVNKLEFNNNSYVQNVLRMHDTKWQTTASFAAKPQPPLRNLLQPIYESRESEQFI